MADEIEIKINRHQMAALLEMLDLAVENATGAPPWVYFESEAFMIECERQAHGHLDWCNRPKECGYLTRVIKFREKYKHFIKQQPELKNRYLDGILDNGSYNS